MNPHMLIFLAGVLLLALFAWYFASENERIKRILGSVITVFVIALAIHAAYPPFDAVDASGKVISPGKIPLGLDLKGGTSFLIRLVAEADEKGEQKEITKTMVDQAVEVIRKRVDKMGTSEPIITPQGKDRILVQIPGLSDEKLAETRQQLQKVAKLEFRLVHPNSAAIIAGQAAPDPAYKMEIHKDEREGQKIEEQLMVKKKVDVPGSGVSAAHAYYDQHGWGVNVSFNSVGTKLWGEVTGAHVGERLAILLDGVVVSAPQIKSAMYEGNAQITGNFTEQEARNLASVLENPLATPVKIEDERSASATLGRDAINSGVNAGMLGIALTIFCVLAYYRFSGVLANIALCVNVIVLFGAMGMFGTVLTLPGIAGVILTLGMAIDANVLIYERIREELATGKSVKAGVVAGFDKAFSAIFDANVTTLITAVILFWKATGPVRGFAVTLTMGIVASLFTALVVTRNLFEWTLVAGILKKVKMSSLISATNFDFLGKRKIAIAVSLAVIGACFAVMAIRGDRLLGVDFKGGDRLVLLAKGEKPPIEDIRKVLADLKLGETVVQMEATKVNEYLTVRSPEKTAERIEGALKEKFPQAQYDRSQLDQVGSLVGSELLHNSVVALLLGMIGILLYVTMRFEFSFALGALVALLHDVIITIGAFALFGRELSLIIVGAVLTIAGYSVNDTIVVFDRIREGIHAGRRGTVLEIMNLSVNEMLSRTILTGGVTLLTTIGLYIFGGPVLNDFAFAILVGVLVGTYSSVFIAAPVVLWWSNRGGASDGLRAEVKRTAQAATA
jgi:SecD/SecF fusion protein